MAMPNISSVVFSPQTEDALRAYRSAPELKGVAWVRLPPQGIRLPPEAKLIREKYDTNKDGKLSQEEFDAMPEPMRIRLAELIRNHRAAQKNKKPKEPSTLKLPPGGFPLPPDATLLREKYDTNKDGKLSQEELDAIPRPLRDEVEERIRKRLAKEQPASRSGPGGGSTPPSVQAPAGRDGPPPRRPEPR
jgi:hypothetical protein